VGYPDFKRKKTQVGTLTQQQLEPWIGGMRLCAMAPGATFDGTGVCKKCLGSSLCEDIDDTSQQT
jgi:hypothetical protein